MEYAVIRTGGKQYIVKPGDVIELDKLPVEKDKTTSFDDVLLWVNDGQVRIGTPTISDVKVKAKVLDQVKGDKIRVAKFKSKVRYRRVTGFRAQLTRVQIEKIESGKTEKSAKTASTAAEAVKNKKPVKSNQAA